MQSLTRKYTFINIVKRRRFFAQFFDKSKLLLLRLHL